MLYHVHITYYLTFICGGGGGSSGVTGNETAKQATADRVCFVGIPKCETTGYF